MHEAVLSWIGQFRSNEDLSVLDIGGRDLNGSPRSLFPNASPYHVLDLHPGPNVDIVADATDQDAVAMWTADRLYDLVICTEVFEHAQRWRDILATAWAALRPGGWILFTCAGPGRPTHSGIAPQWELIGDEYYANVSPEEIREEMKGAWTDVEVHLRGTDTQGKAVKPIRAADPIEGTPGLDPYAVDEPREHLFGAVLSRTQTGG